ncbi:MAG: sulfur carrier protein ThiS [Alteromonadaceae bacterium]|nr:sulfur carrier protein ThiS [Alteromonadaceae bacterium]
MKIKINGHTFELNSELTNTLTNELENKKSIYLNDALSRYFNNQQQSTFALALNGEFVGKDDYCSTSIKANDSIDILFPIQGG